MTAMTGKAVSVKKFANIEDQKEEELEFSEIYDENKDNRPILAKKINNFEPSNIKNEAEAKITLTRNINFILKRQQKQYLNSTSRF
jgi:hypothetical protein